MSAKIIAVDELATRARNCIPRESTLCTNRAELRTRSVRNRPNPRARVVVGITRLAAKDNIPPFSGRLPTQKDPVDFAKEIRVPVPERMKRRRSSRERVAESGLSARSPEKFAIF